MVHATDCKCAVPAIKVGSDDICPICGAKRRGARISRPTALIANKSFTLKDHLETVLGPGFAAVSDRGRAHPTNQDFVTIAEAEVGTQKAQIVVVCDGVSSSQNAATASRKGATEASSSLKRLLQARVDVKDAIRLSIIVADRAVRAIPFDPDSKEHPPGATIVAVVFFKGLITVGWIGDSRCYLLNSSGLQQLTHDHSWINMVVETGKVSRAFAERQPDAHRICRCIGPIFESKSTDEQPIEINQVKVTSPGRMVVCTDGFWNYIYKPEILQKLVAVGPTAPDAISQANSLVNFACGQGGKDNVTVAILAVN